MQLQLAFELRSPACGASHRELYAAMLDICAWADELGFDMVNFGEHHGADSGYNPSPLIACAAVAGRTRRIRMRPNVLLAPLYDPVKLAEDCAVLALIAPQRFSLAIGGGYRPSEFAMFDRRLDERWAAIGELVAFLRRAWTGEACEFRGRTVRVRPVPDPAPQILLGGSSAAAARRAARIADGWLPPLDPRLWMPYREECIALGKPDPGAFPAYGPTFLWLAQDADAAWDMLEPHVLSQIEEYGAFTREGFGEAKGPYKGRTDPASLRTNRAYQVLSPPQLLALADTLGPDGVLLLNPLLGGIAPGEAWKMLRLFEREVLPALLMPSSSQLMWALLKPLVGFDPNQVNLFEQPIVKNRMVALLGPNYDTTMQLLRTANELRREGPLFYVVSRYTPVPEMAQKAGLVWNSETNQMAVALMKGDVAEVFAEKIEAMAETQVARAEDAARDKVDQTVPGAVVGVIPVWPAEMSWVNPREAIGEAVEQRVEQGVEQAQKPAD